MIDQEDEDIHVYLPRFELNTKLRLVDLLKRVCTFIVSLYISGKTFTMQKRMLFLDIVLCIRK
jgi:hypothetical protein